MKNKGLLNSEINYTISKLGHKDSICISDAGLPIPENVKRIDLAIEKNLPKFIDVVRVASLEMHVEKIILAEEIKKHNKIILNEVKKLFPNIKIQYCSHELFKLNTKKSKAIIRTGEFSAYANVIIVSGVKFD